MAEAEALAERAQLADIGRAGFRLEFEQRTAGEIDAEIHAPDQEGGDRDDRKQGRERVAHAPEAHEGEVGLLGGEAEEFHGCTPPQIGSTVGRFQRYQTAIIMRVMVTAVTTEVRMPRPSDTAKPRTGTGTEEVQDRGGNEHRDVRVDDGREGPAEPRVERLQDRAAGMRLLTDALVDQHVGVDRDADGENDARNTGQRQRRPEQHHESEDQQDVHAERDIGENAEHAIGDEHVAEHQDAGHIGGALAGVDRVLAEAGPDGSLFHDGQLGRQGAGAQQHRKVIRLLDREVA